ncbi:MAG TPA: DUF1905 domain-containing protein [Clostridiales bacterium]|nr:DUF1905 domain-containing protein [Clostridiales bacterium]
MKQEFDAVIRQHEGIDGAYIVPPFDVREVYGAKRVKVIATFDGVGYRGSLVTMGGSYVIGMTQEVRRKIGKSFGDTVHVTLEKDVEERTVEAPDDFMEGMKQSPEALANYEKLSFTAKKEYVTWITAAKKAETRQSRIEKTIGQLKQGRKLR